MTDINSGGTSGGPCTQSARGSSRDASGAPASDEARGDASIAMVELLFFAYRDFTGEADAMLAELGFGRAHHRVLHFVWRNPGLRVADLLDILKITKQSLARVLRQLIEEGYVEQAAGAADRRERRLYATARGTGLMQRLVGRQAERISRALAEAGPGAEAAAQRFLFAMIGESDREGAAALTGIGAAGGAAPAREAKP